MAQAAKTQEPSMEEILASIRRIIADDDNTKPKAAEPERAPKPTAPPAAAAPAPLKPIDLPKPNVVPEPAEDVLDLTEAMEVPAPNVVGFQTVEVNEDLVFGEPPQDEPPAASVAEPEAAPEPPPAAEPAPVEEPAPQMVVQARREFEHTTGSDRSLLSPSTTAAVDSAFNALAQTVLVQNARTLDDLVREMLRPMLKAWLDDNLPNMVERLVRAEIDRVSRGRG
jgi:cell pole-organizing protein PopZ